MTKSVSSGFEHHLVTEGEARSFFRHQVKHVPDDSLRVLRRVAIEGGLDGRRYDSCVYGNMAKGAGLDFRELTPDEICHALRRFGKQFRIRIRANGHMDILEQFFARVTRDETWHTSKALSLLVVWCDEIIQERERGPTDRALENLNTAGGMSVIA